MTNERTITDNLIALAGIGATVAQVGAVVLLAEFMGRQEKRWKAEWERKYDEQGKLRDHPLNTQR